MKDNVYKSIGVVVVGTLLGRLTGFFKHFIIVKLFGLSSSADSFFVVNTVSEIIVNLLIAGLLTGAFIPIASEFMAKANINIFANFFRLCFLLCGSFLLILSGIMFIFSEQLAPTLAPGFSQNQLDEISFLLKILSPGLLFAGFAALLNGVLHVFNDFTVPAFGLFTANCITIIITLTLYSQLGISAPVFGMTLVFFYGL